MKKLSFLLALTLGLSLLAGCARPASSTPPASSGAASSGAVSSEAASGSASGEPAQAQGSLEEIMDKVFEGIPEEDMPMLMPADLNGGSKYAELTADNSEYNVGVPRDAYKEGVAADAAMSSVAHSVCLLRAESAEAAEQLAKDVEANADPRKWICVEAEKKIVSRSGDLVLLIMTGADLADKLDANFQALAG